MPDKLSAHFSRKEFECRCGCGFCDVDALLIAGLEALRATIHKPIIVLSGCRCGKHNAAEGGASKSLHVSGRAADIRVKGMTARTLYAAARLIPEFKGYGVSDRGAFLHVDVREHSARWCYKDGLHTKWFDV
jgi:uncharacterized protein YcbK (DUF882 family)